MVLALGLAHSQQAIEAQRAVTDMTNELLKKKNAATLKQGTIAAAKESERGIVDIETLQQTNRKPDRNAGRGREDPERRQRSALRETELGRIEGRAESEAAGDRPLSLYL